MAIKETVVARLSIAVSSLKDLDVIVLLSDKMWTTENMRKKIVEFAMF